MAGPDSIIFDDSLVGGEARVVFLAAIRRAWQDAGLPDASGLLDRHGLTRTDEVEAIRWLTDKTARWARAREDICDLAGVDHDYLRERAVKALGGEDAIAARLAPGAAMLTTAEIFRRKRDVTSQLPSAAERQRIYMKRYKQRRTAERVAAGIPVRPGAELAATMAAKHAKAHFAPASPAPAKTQSLL